MARKSIQGITIEIGGDTRKLQTALQGVEKKIKGTQDALKDVSRLLKLDPGNTELLTQKQKLLGDAIEGTKDKLKTLKEANVDAAESAKRYDDWKKAQDPIQEEIKQTSEELKKLKEAGKKADEQFKAGKISEDKYKAVKNSIKETEDKLKALQEQSKAVNEEFGHPISPEQYDAIQREIIETENNLKSLTQQMKNFGSVSAQQIAAAGQKVKDVGDKISKLGTGMTKYITGPIVAAGAAATAAWNEVDAGMDIIATKTGATGDALADMQRRAENLATSIPTEFATAGAAVGEVNSRFGLTGDMLEDVSGKFIRFAQINNTDVSSSIDTVQSAMAAYDISASRVGDVLDILNAASQETGVGVDKLSQQLLSNATALQEMGYSFAGSAQFLAQLEKNGVDSSIAIAGLRTALKNATKDGKTMSQAVSDLQVRITEARSRTEAMSAATEVFGSKAGPTLGAALYEGRMSLDELNASMSQFAGSVDSTFEATLDPMDGFKTAMNELKLTGAELVNDAAPMIQQAATMLKNTFSNLREWWSGLSPMARETIVKLAAITAAVGPVLVAVGKLTGAIGSIMTYAPQIKNAIDIAKGALSGLWSVLMANPIVLVVAAITAAVAAIIYFWNTSEEFRQFWINLWADIKNVVVAAWNAISSFFSNLWGKITSTAESAWNSFSEKVTGIWDGLRASAERIWQGISDVFSTVTDGIGKTLDEKWSNIKRAYEENGGGLKGIAAATMEAIKGYFTFGFDALNNITGGKLNGIKEKFAQIMDSIKKVAGNVWNDITGFFRSAIDKLRSFFDFKWELPKIPLPHFNVTGQFSLNPPQIPHFSVDWYKKAMQDGMILTSPTIFGAQNGRLLGGGEAGPEAVVGVDSLRGMITAAVAQATPRGRGAQSATISLVLNGVEIGRAFLPLIEAEQQRVGVRLAKTPSMAT